MKISVIHFAFSPFQSAFPQQLNRNPVTIAFSHLELACLPRFQHPTSFSVLASVSWRGKSSIKEILFFREFSDVESAIFNTRSSSLGCCAGAK
jgi:hypothetical protein